MKIAGHIIIYETLKSQYLLYQRYLFLISNYIHDVSTKKYFVKAQKLFKNVKWCSKTDSDISYERKTLDDSYTQYPEHEPVQRSGCHFTKF